MCPRQPCPDPVNLHWPSSSVALLFTHCTVYIPSHEVKGDSLAGVCHTAALMLVRLEAWPSLCEKSKRKEKYEFVGGTGRLDVYSKPFSPAD